MTRKMILEFISGCVFSVVGSICFGVIYTLVSKRFETIFFGGDKAGVFFTLCLGLPIGSLVGISLVDKLMFKSQGHNIFGLTMGFILCQLGIFFSVFLLDVMGTAVIAFTPFIAAFSCLVGYNIKLK